MHRFLLAAAPLVLVLAACSGGAGATTAPARTTAPATAAAATTAPATAGAVTVTVASGGYFTGPNGKTLYTFDKDSLNTTVCTGDCLANWPPLTVGSAGAIVLGSGLLGPDFATITRDDGTLQVTFKEIPLYYFAGDAAAGDVNGDGVGGVWHIATISSTLPPPPASTAATTAPSAAASCGPDDPYCEPATAQPSASTGAEGSVSVNKSAAGDFLVDTEGMSLYTWDNDPANESTCTGDCAGNWPALTVADEDELPAAGTDVTGTIAVIETEDGAYVVTYNGRALYHFAGDAAAGDTNGDGVGDVWHLAAL